MPGRNRLGDARQLQGQLGDHSERSFRAHEEAREIVTSGRFLCAASCGDHVAVGQHGFEGQHIVLHGAVAHRIGTGATRCRHTPERGVRAGIEGEEQALIAQVLVELLAGDTRLDQAVEVGRIHREHLVHVAKVDGHAAKRRVHVPLQRGAGSESDHRNAVRRADAHDVLHVARRLRIDDCIRRLIGNPGRGVAMLLAHRTRRNEVISELRGQRRDRRGDGPSITLHRLEFCFHERRSQ